MKLFLHYWLTAILTLFLFISTAIAAKNPLGSANEDWQTFETDNFRVHFTPEYKAWAVSAAHESEIARKLIIKHQDRIIEEKIDIFIIDPFNDSNGFAVPLSEKPYMAYFTTPPQSNSMISNAPSWTQLLALHEYVHVVHLGQKSRSDWRQSLRKAWDLFDVSQMIEERWVAEGYATLLESKLSGRGRLYDDSVEAIIQQFAIAGALPTYQQLSDTTNDYLAGSMAYLMGVRYMNWLEEKYGSEKLDAIWTRTNGIKNRNFEQSFKGIYNTTAEKLYKRFIAEFTYDAMKQEQQVGATKSSLWADLSGYANSTILSPNEQMLGVITRDKNGKQFLTIYDVADNTKAKENFNKAQKELLADDPNDIADTPPSVFARKMLHTLPQRNYRSVQNARWLNNEAILFTAYNQKSNGKLNQDLFKWNIKTNAITQLSVEQNLRRFDISADGNSIIAERNQFGYSDLVRFDLTSKTIKQLTEKSLGTLYDFPRFHPTENKVAFLSMQLNQVWQLNIQNLTSGKISQVPMPEGYQFMSYPEWQKDGTGIYFIAGTDGLLKLYQYNFKSQQLTALTHGADAIAWPSALENGDLIHLSINAEGPDIFKLTQTNFDNATVKTTMSSRFSGEIPNLALPKAKIHQDESIGSFGDYGIGSQEGTLTLSETFNKSNSELFEIGYKQTDLLNRFGVQIAAGTSLSSDAFNGFSGNIEYNGLPISLKLHAYDLELDGSEFNKTGLLSGTLEESGYRVSASKNWLFDTLNLEAEANLVSQSYETASSEITDDYSSLVINQSYFHDRQNWGFTQRATLRYLDGELENDNWTGQDLQLGIEGYYRKVKLGIEYFDYARDDSDGSLLTFGGFQSTLVSANTHANKILEPALPFYYQASNDYSKFEVYSPINGGRLFHTTHEMNGNNKVDIYGYRFSSQIDSMFTGLHRLNFNGGIVKVDEDGKDSSTKFWLGLFYNW